MRQLISLCFILIIPGFIFGQDSDESVDYNGKKNELSLDIVPLFQQIFPSQAYSISPSPYFLKYRRLMAGWNVRAQLGGEFYRRPLSNRPNATITEDRFDRKISYSVAVGAELLSSIKNIAQINYGLDLHVSRLERDDDGSASQGGYYLGHQTENTSFGVGPVLGIRFWLWERVSIGTEASFQLNFYKNRNRTKELRYSYDFPELPPEPWEVEEGFQTVFNVPLQLWIGVTL